MDVGGSGSVSRIFIIWIKAVFQINFISSYCSATFILARLDEVQEELLYYPLPLSFFKLTSMKAQGVLEDRPIYSHVTNTRFCLTCDKQKVRYG